MTYDVIAFDIFSLENLMMSGVLAAFCAFAVAAISAISQMKQPDLRPIPIRVRPDDRRMHQTRRTYREFR
jgi:hypothetical protein